MVIAIVAGFICNYQYTGVFVWEKSTLIASTLQYLIYTKIYLKLFQLLLHKRYKYYIQLMNLKVYTESMKNYIYTRGGITEDMP